MIATIYLAIALALCVAVLVLIYWAWGKVPALVIRGPGRAELAESHDRARDAGRQPRPVARKRRAR